ncbi:hypothetical protein LZ31DRAFT_603555 [Colletotrichum somersetense]|nr:hypothetical protein LZ31DRAFT_603555 [Colletotrichum somersetense]
MNVTQLLSELDAIEEAIKTVKASIITLNVVDITTNFSSNSILNLAINNALLQTQSLTANATLDESRHITEVFQTKIAPDYQEILQLLESKLGELKAAATQLSDILNARFEGDNWLDVISSGLTLGLANQLCTALIKVLDPAYQNAAYEAGIIIQKALDSCILATAS